jgi:hypothetical protein
MRTILVILTICYAVDAMAYDGRYLRQGINATKMFALSINRDVARWVTPG